MSRKALAAINGQRRMFIGTFRRFGEQINAYGISQGGTVLLGNICDKDGNKMADHMWFKLTPRGFKDLDLSAGDRIQFTATVEPYEKRVNRWDHQNHDVTIDYTLTHLRGITYYNGKEG